MPSVRMPDGPPGVTVMGDRSVPVNLEVIGLVAWRLVYTRQAQRDAREIAGAGLRERVQALLETRATDPMASPPPYERVLGDLGDACSRRINIQHRLVYQVLPEDMALRVLRM